MILKPLDDWNGLRGKIQDHEVNDVFGLSFDNKDIKQIRQRIRNL